MAKAIHANHGVAALGAEPTGWAQTPAIAGHRAPGVLGVETAVVVDEMVDFFSLERLAGRGPRIVKHAPLPFATESLHRWLH